MRRTLLCGAAVLVVARVALPAEAPDFSGTWKLDPSRSRITTATLAGLIKAGAPDTLHITQAANGTLVVESQINESQSRIYLPGGTSSTPVVPSGTITMTSRWEGRTLVSEGTQESTSGGSTSVKEVLTLGADGRTLTIAVTTTTPDNTSASTLTYTRTTIVEPCQKWPTPCKSP
jgi:hypothetical protein